MSSPSPSPSGPSASNKSPPSSKSSSNNNNNNKIGSLSILDLLRVLGGVLLLSSGLSYLATSGDSLTWGYNAWWTRARDWRALLQGQVLLTDAELLAYDGTDPSKPIYVALNGTIYDVSANPKTYGPGGSYHFFAGHDAARAFLTGCFAEDITPDLRGVEQMYIPKEPETASPNSAPLSKSQLKIRREQDLRIARKKVKEGLEGWHVLFRGDKGKPYFRVGEVVREEGWLESLPKRALCQQAEDSRPVRKAEGEKEEE